MLGNTRGFFGCMKKLIEKVMYLYGKVEKKLLTGLEKQINADWSVLLEASAAVNRSTKKLKSLSAKTDKMSFASPAMQARACKVVDLK